MNTNLEKLIAHCEGRCGVITLASIVEHAPVDAEYVSITSSPYARLKKRKDDNFYMIMRRGKWISSLTYKSDLEQKFVKIDDIREYLKNA